MSSNTIKINAVIASCDKLHRGDNGYRTYGSVEEMTPSMQQKYEECMAGDYTGTILIFDPKGKEEILRTLRGEKTSFNAAMPDSVRKQLRKGDLGHLTPNHGKNSNGKNSNGRSWGLPRGRGDAGRDGATQGSSRKGILGGLGHWGNQQEGGAYHEAERFGGIGGFLRRRRSSDLAGNRYAEGSLWADHPLLGDPTLQQADWTTRLLASRWLRIALAFGVPALLTAAMYWAIYTAR